MNDVTEPITPVFLFSLPRSGSTLTQRMLATHPDVATAGEPWILLPFFYMRMKSGVYAEYAQRVLNTAIEEFCDGLPGGPADFMHEIREMTLRLYRARAGRSARFFVDKSPRYHVISADIVRLFPDARIVFLWRNPLAIVSSLIETWGAGRWNIYEFEFDLFEGLAGLVAGKRAAGQRACSIQFENVVNHSSGAMASVFEHLGLDFDAERTGRFNVVKLAGRMQDPTGTHRYRELSREPVERWKTTLRSPVRKWWCRGYLRWIGRERLAIMGYDLDQLLNDLDSLPSRFSTVPSDIVRMIFGVAVRTFEPWIIRDKIARLGRGGRLYALS